MKWLVKMKIGTPLWVIVLLVLLAILLLSFFLFLNVENYKFSTVVGGICAGLTVYIVSFIIEARVYLKLDRFVRMGVREVLPNRRDTDYYRELVSKADKSVIVVGTSCTRFVDDFGNAKNDDHVLIEALNHSSSLKVKLFVPDDDHMSDSLRERFRQGEDKLRDLITGFPDRVEVRRFSSDPRYSFVLIDEEFIVGPVFINAESKDAPAIHLDTNSKFAEKYLKDFWGLWDQSPRFE